MAKAKAEAKIAKTVVKAVVPVAELRKKSVKELQEALYEVRKDLADARRSLSAGELVNPQVIGRYKKDIARIKTINVEQLKANLGKEDA